MIWGQDKSRAYAYRKALIDSWRLLFGFESSIIFSVNIYGEYKCVPLWFGSTSLNRVKIYGRRYWSDRQFYRRKSASHMVQKREWSLLGSSAIPLIADEKNTDDFTENKQFAF